MIYKITDDSKQALDGMLKPVTTEEILGEAEVRALFKVRASARSQDAWSRTASFAGARSSASSATAP